MNPFLLILLQAGVNIGKAHVTNAAGGEILDTTSFILDAAKAIDDLHQEENGTPLDWRTIRHHSHLPPSGEPATEGPPADVTNPGPIPEEVDSPEGESLEADVAAGPEDPDADNPNPENPAES